MTIQIDPNAAHAVYAPSSAHRWEKCRGSAEAIAMLPPQESGEEADEGTEAHDEIDRILGRFNGQIAEPAEIRKTAKELLNVDHPAAFGIALTIDYIAKLPRGRLWIEQRVALTPQIWGRCDICHWHEETGTLTIIDYKNGKRAVDAEKNPQTRIYAAGTMFTRKLPVKWIRYVIVQPNDWRPFVPRVKQWPESVDSLYAWVSEIAAIPSGPRRFKVGAHCRDCPLFGLCDESRDALRDLSAVMAGMMSFETLRPEQVALFLALQKPIEDQFKKMKEYWQKKAIAADHAPPGMMLVTTVAHRAWIDEEAARDAVYKAKGLDGLKPPTPAQAEAMGIDVSTLSRKPDGVPALAFAGDKRKPWHRPSALEMFKGIVEVVRK